MTGVEINQIYSQQIGQTYSGIEDIPKKNRRFKKALINAIEEKYRNLNEQREFDEIRSLISSQELTPTSNYIDFATNNTSHVLAVKAKYKRIIPGLTIKDITNTSPIVLELFTPNNIRTGDTILLENVLGNTAANNNEFLAIVKNRYKIELYTANGPTAGNGQFVQSPLTKISRVFYNYCQFLKSDEKISSFKGATEDYPLYEISNNKIVFYPYAQGSIAPSKVTIDQISNATVFFDLNDNTIDYSVTYPDKFIYHVIDLAAKDFDITFRDYQNSQATDQQILLNP